MANANNETKVQSLAAKVAQISGEIDKIAKTGTNTEQKYKYIEYAMVAGKIRELCAKYNLAIIPQVDGYEVTEVKSRNGTTGFHYLTQMSFLIVNGDRPEEREERRWTSEATDYGDKGINKSITAGEKYFIMRLFHISEKDSEDADKTTPEPIATTSLNYARKASPNKEASEKQLSYLRTLYKQGGLEDEEIDRYMESAKSMTSQQISQTIERTKARLDEKQKEEELPTVEEVV